jgi:hypothetical protein
VTASLLLCWYSLGFVACGLNFALLNKYMRVPIAMCFMIPPSFLIIIVCLAGMSAIERVTSRIDPSKQYLWRRRP